MNAAWVLCLFVLSRISQSESLTLQFSTSGGNRRVVSVPVPQRASMPAVTIPVARQTQPTNANIPSITTDASFGTVNSNTPTTVGSGTVFSGTPTTVGTAGLDVLRRGSELIADRIASALGGVGVLVDILRNTSVNGDVVWANLGSTSQALATRLLTVGMNTANTLLQELNGQLTINTNPSNVLQNFLNVPNVDQMASSFSRSPQVSNQVFFPNRIFSSGQQSNAKASVPTAVETLNNISDNLSSTLPNNISDNLSSTLPNNISDNLSSTLPNLSTISTSGAGLNIPSTLTDNSVAENFSNAAQNVNSNVETFLDNLGLDNLDLDNLGNTAGVDVNP